MKGINFIQLIISGWILCAIISGCTKSSPSPTGSGNNNGGSGNGSGSGNQKAVFSFQASGNQCINASVAGTYKQQTALGASNTVTISVNVSQAGSWTVSTNIVNGMSFYGSGTFSATGNQTIVLKGSGTPINAGTFALSVSASSSTCSFPVTVAGNSTTYIRGIKSMLFTFTGISNDLETNLYQTSDEVNGGIALSLSRLTAQGDTVVARLVNANKGTMHVWDDYYFSQLVVSFSNVNTYGPDANLANVDTTGKIQIWIYRKDGKDIVPASNGRPAIKTIIQVPGTFADLPTYSGAISMRYPYFNPWYNINATFMENLFASTDWKLGIFNRRH